MGITTESLEKLQAILKADHGRDFTLDETREIGRRLLTFVEGYCKWYERQHREPGEQLTLGFDEQR